MKRFCALSLVGSLLLIFSLFGCAKKNDLSTADAQPHNTQIGRVYTGSSSKGVLLLAPDGSSSDVWKSKDDILIWQDEVDFSQTIAPSTPASTKEFLFDGYIYHLKYVDTYTRSGKSVHRYGLYEADITDDMLANVPEAERIYFHSNNPETPISIVSFLSGTDKVSLISNLPGGYFANGTETEVFLKQRAIDIAKPYTEEPFETYMYSCATSYEIYDTSEKETCTDVKTVPEIHAIKDNEKLEYYEIRYTRYVQQNRTDGFVIVRFYGYGGMTVQYSNAAFTDYDYEKIMRTDQNVIIDQLTNFIKQHIADGWIITECKATAASFGKYDDTDDNFLYLTVSFSITICHAQDNTWIRTLRLYLYAEIL